MDKVRKWFYKYVFDMNNDQAMPEDIHENIISGIKLKGSPLVILFCAIVIASVGLSRNSGAVVIGAMLISPLMGTIIAMGYSLSTNNYKNLKFAIISFLAQIAIALTGSILYFTIFPVATPTAELIARTQPSIFDFLIAFFGGSAGIVGTTRKEKTNVIPGVAIATALMPPLCTVGYGISTGNLEFILNPFYLFLINTFFILMSTMLFCKLFNLKKVGKTVYEREKLVKTIIIVCSVLISIPAISGAFLISYKTVKDSSLQTKIEIFINEEVNNENTQVINYNVNESVISIDLIGDGYSNSQINDFSTNLVEYNLEGYELVFTQGIEESLMKYFKNGKTLPFQKK